jgi:hypothetical protein
MVDKPQPPGYRPTRRPPPQYDYEEHQTVPVSSSTISTVSNSLLTAYKINPIMIAMVLLLLAILGALGFYMMRNDDRIYAYIAARDAQRADLYDRLIEMALKCKDKGPAPDLYPQLEFPQVITKPAPTPNKRDGK